MAFLWAWKRVLLVGLAVALIGGLLVTQRPWAALRPITPPPVFPATPIGRLAHVIWKTRSVPQHWTALWIHVNLPLYPGNQPPAIVTWVTNATLTSQAWSIPTDRPLTTVTTMPFTGTRQWIAQQPAQWRWIATSEP